MNDCRLSRQIIAWRSAMSQEIFSSQKSTINPLSPDSLPNNSDFTLSAKAEKIRPGYQRLCLDSLLRDTLFLVPVKDGPRKQIWVLGRVGHNQLPRISPCEGEGSGILFLLALNILWMGCRSILERSRLFLRIQCRRVKLVL